MTSNKSQQELRRDLNIILVIAGCSLWVLTAAPPSDDVLRFFFFFSVWKPSVKKELDLGNSLIPLLSSFHHSLISPSSLLYRKVQQAKQSSSSCSFFFFKNPRETTLDEPEPPQQQQQRAQTAAGVSLSLPLSADKQWQMEASRWSDSSSLSPKQRQTRSVRGEWFRAAVEWCGYIQKRGNGDVSDLNILHWEVERRRGGKEEVCDDQLVHEIVEMGFQLPQNLLLFSFIWGGV